MLRRNRMLVRSKDGSWELRLDQDHRALLASLADQLDEIVAEDPDNPGLARLFPVAYPDDIAHEAEWQVFKAGELRSGLQEHLAVLRSVATTPSLRDDEVTSWLRAINALRLVLGTRLDVSEDEVAIDADDPDAPSYALYEFLGYLLDRTVSDLSR